MGSWKILGMVGPYPLSKGARLTPRNTLIIQTHYHAIFGHHRSNLLGAGKGSKKLDPPLQKGRGWPPRNTLLSQVRYHTKFRHSRRNRVGTGSGSQIVKKHKYDKNNKYTSAKLILLRCHILHYCTSHYQYVAYLEKCSWNNCNTMRIQLQWWKHLSNQQQH